MTENHLAINQLINLLSEIATQQGTPNLAISTGISRLSYFLQKLQAPFSRIWLAQESGSLQEIALNRPTNSPIDSTLSAKQRTIVEDQWFQGQLLQGDFNGSPAKFFPFISKNKICLGGVLIAFDQPISQNWMQESEEQLLLKICQIIGNALQQRNRSLQVARPIENNLDLQRLLKEIYLQVKMWLQPDYFFVALLDPTESFLEIKYAVNRGRDNTEAAKKYLISIDNPTSLTASVIRNKQSLQINNIGLERKNFSNFIEEDDSPVSMLFAPLKYNDQIKGVISIQKGVENGFTQENLTILEQMAIQVAMTLEIQNLYNQEFTRRSEAETLHLLASKFVQVGNNKDQILDATIEAIFKLTPQLDIVTILAKTKNKSEIVCLANDNRSKVENIMQVGELYDISLLDQDGMWKGDTELPACYPDFSLNGTTDKINSSSNYSKESISSIYTFGMESSGTIAGYIVLTWINQPYTLLTHQISFLQNIANQTAIALDRINFSEAERDQYQLARTLRDMGLYLTIDLAIDEFYERLFDLLSRVVKFDSVALYLKDPVTNQYTLFSNRNIVSSSKNDYTHNDIVEISLARFKNDRLVCCIPNTVVDESWIDHSKIKSWVGALLRIKGEVIGLLNVNSFKSNTYDEEITQTVLAFANHASIALESSRLYERLERRINELSIINQFSREASHTNSIDQLVDSACKVIFRQKPEVLFGLGLIEEEKTILCTWSDSPPEKKVTIIPDISYLSFYEGIVGRTLRENKPQLINDVRFDPDYVEIHEGTRSQICVPLQDSNAKVLGILNLESPKLNAFSNNDLIFTTTLADQISGTIQRLQLHERLQQYAVDLEEEVYGRTVELREQRDRIEKILQNAGEGIFFTDTNRKIIYTNEALCKETGFSSEELIGSSPTLFMIPPEEDSINRIFSEDIKHTPYRANILNKHKNGSEFWTNCIVTPIFDDSLTLTGHVGILANINSLIQAEQIKNRFVTNVSHELRTPLTNIKVYLDLIKRSGNDGKKVPKYMGILDNEVMRLERLIQDLLRLSIIDSGDLKISPIHSSLKIAIKEKIDGWEKRFEDEGIQFTISEPEIDVLARFDQIQMISIRDHLLSNALNYSTKGDSVTLSIGYRTYQNENMAFISVVDTGMGMTPRESGMLFDRFFRGAEAQARQITGTGLGLSITKEIVDRHDGAITVQSTLGEGSTFTVYLPAASSD